MTNDQGRKKPEFTKSKSASQDALRSIGHSDFAIPLTFVIRISSLALVSVVADGFDRAAFLGFFALRFLFRRARLFIDKRVAAVIVAFEIVGSGFATEVAVDALVIDVKFSGDVFGVSVCDLSHNLRF